MSIIRNYREMRGGPRCLDRVVKLIPHDIVGFIYVQAEELFSGVQGEGGAGGVAGRAYGGGANVPLRRSSEPDLPVEEAGHGWAGGRVFGKGGAYGRGRRETDREAPRQDRAVDGGAVAGGIKRDPEMPPGGDKPVVVLLRGARGEPVEPFVDAADRRAVSGDAVVREPSDGLPCGGWVMA